MKFIYLLEIDETIMFASFPLPTLSFQKQISSVDYDIRYSFILHHVSL